MRDIILLLFLMSSPCVFCKINMKALTESNGQEVIEIGSPLKELPPDLEEEPSAENDDDIKSTANTHTPATKREGKKAMTTETRRNMKDVDKIDGVSPDDEESRIEKELAEIYKDNADYKADSSDEKQTTEAETATTSDEDKPIGRARNSFKFQPDQNNREEVERFRTSVDEISCDRSVTKKLDLNINTDDNNSAIICHAGYSLLLLSINSALSFYFTLLL